MLERCFDYYILYWQRQFASCVQLSKIRFYRSQIWL